MIGLRLAVGNAAGLRTITEVVEVAEAGLPPAGVPEQRSADGCGLACPVAPSGGSFFAPCS